MNLRGREGGAMPELDDVASLRAAEGGSSRSYAIAFASKAGGGGSYREDGLAPTLTSHGDDEGGQPPAMSDGVGVRRLTPRECERLQGLPDDWTLLDDKTPDSRRYSALGDAVTANVADWIGARLAAA
jgi:DNA (cytosine-5)-methyltransferase 1